MKLFRNREIKNNTKRIANGTTTLAFMSDRQFTSFYKRMEAKKLKNPCKYKIAEWFTIKFIEKENDEYEFCGSFVDGDTFPLVYKDQFLKILKKNHVYHKEIKKNVYKIVRKVVA